MNKQLVKLILCIIVLFCSIVLLGQFTSRSKCYNSWQDSGFKVEYTMAGGCRINIKENVWIPASALRDINTIK